MKNFIKKNPLFPLILLCLILSFFFIFSQARLSKVSSDVVQIIMETEDILQGNVLLSNWFVSADNFYFTDVVPFSLFFAVFGSHNFLGFYLFSAISYELILVVAVFVSVKSLQFSYANIASLCVVLILIGYPSVSGIPIFPMFHLLTVLYGLIAFILLTKIRQINDLKQSQFLVFAFIFVGIITVSSDPYILFIAYAPMLLVLGTGLLFSDNQRQDFYLIVLVLFASLAGKITSAILLYLGWHNIVHNLSFGINPADKMSASIVAFLFGFLYLSSAYIFGTFVFSKAFFFAGARLAIWLAGFSQAIKMLPSKNQKRIGQQQFFNACLATSCIVIALACCFSSMFSFVPITPQTGEFFGGPLVRYVDPVIIYAGILVARLSNDFVSKLPLKMTRAIISCSLVFVFLCIAINSLHPSIKGVMAAPWAKHNPYVSVSKYLEDQHLTCGIGDYWASATTTILSHKKVIVRAVVAPEGGKIEPFLWLTKASWYKGDTSPSFYLSPNMDKRELPSIISTYGPPLRIEQAYGFTIFVLPQHPDHSSFKIQCDNAR